MRITYIVLIILALSFACASVYAARCMFVRPANIGSGPVPEIQNLIGRDFDWAYLKTMYQQNADIGALALLGSQEACDRPLRILSNKIISERTDMNEDIRSWSWIYVNQVMQPAGTQRFVSLQRALSCLKGSDFDCAYASAMICLMQQSADAADLAMEKSTIPEVYRAARVVGRTNSNEIAALKNWQCTGYLK